MKKPAYIQLDSRVVCSAVPAGGCASCPGHSRARAALQAVQGKAGQPSQETEAFHVCDVVKE